MKPPRKSTLLPAQAGLIELMQRLDFGTIEGLVIQDGLPVLKPRPRVIRDVKERIAELGPISHASFELFE